MSRFIKGIGEQTKEISKSRILRVDVIINDRSIDYWPATNNTSSQSKLGFLIPSLLLTRLKADS